MSKCTVCHQNRWNYVIHIRHLHIHFWKLLSICFCRYSENILVSSGKDHSKWNLNNKKKSSGFVCYWWRRYLCLRLRNRWINQSLHLINWTPFRLHLRMFHQGWTKVAACNQLFLQQIDDFAFGLGVQLENEVFMLNFLQTFLSFSQDLVLFSVKQKLK